MNLEDLLDEKGLQQDEWSLTAPTFGSEGQLRVIGWSGRNTGGDKLYILNCYICSQDTELFGDGCFKSRKSNLVILRQVPCACNTKFKWSVEQYFIRCNRCANQVGNTFLGFTGEWKGRNTKVRVLCKKHGEWCSGTISKLTGENGTGCPSCKVDSIRKALIKPDEDMIQSFFASGAFHPDTKFWRSTRSDKKGYFRWWHVLCPECGENGESASYHLQKGGKPCGCSKHRQQECYINLILDDLDSVMAIKFGVANNSSLRARQQDRNSVYTVKQHLVYVFPSVESCKKAERDCKQELECGIVLKRDFPDGYTETTWSYNLEKIIEIYERNGGVVS